MKLLVILLFAFCLSTIQSQAALDCLDSNDCTYVSTKTLNYDLRAPTCDISVNYDVWDCGGIRSIRINSYTVDGSCEAMTDFSIYHYNLSTLNEYISLALLEVEAHNGTVPLCSTGTNTIIKVYTASCGIWVGCEYEVDPASRICDMGYLAPYPDYGSSPTKVKVYKWQSCGEVCCENKYSICFKPSTTGGTNLYVMTKISSEPKGECSLQSNYSSTCQNGCM